MRRTVSFFVFAFLFFALIDDVHAEFKGYYTHPDIYGDQIVFSSENDLWMVSADGGLARRLTSHDGREAYARFSPDGSTIAFVGEYEGNLDIYTIPATGGVPERLTFHPSADVMADWSPDGESIYFRSDREHPFRTPEVFEISSDGGFPEKLPIGRASSFSISDDGDLSVFNRNDVERRTWKRYLGGLADDVWLANLESGDFTQLTKFPGNDFAPLFVGEMIFFASERDGRMNLWSVNQDGSDLTQHTEFTDFDVRFPQTDGESRIVFQYGADIYLYDVDAGESSKIEITLPSDRRQARARFVDASDYIESAAISNDGKRTIVSARGELFHVPVGDGRILPLTDSPDARELVPRYIGEDEMRMVFFSDQSGDYEVYTSSARVVADEELITDPENPDRGYFEPFFELEVSPDGEAIAFADQTTTLYWSNVTTKTLTRIDESDNFEVRRYVWSPDSRYLAYIKPGKTSFNQVWIYDTETEEKHLVSDPMTNCYDVAWDPDENYLFYFAAREMQREKSWVEYESIVVRPDRLYGILLTEEARNPFETTDPLEEYDEEKLEEEEAEAEEESDSEESDEEAEADEEEEEKFEILFDGIDRRHFAFPIDAGDYGGLFATADKVFFYDYDTDELKFMSYMVDEPEVEVFAGDVDDYYVSTNREHIVIERHNGLEAVATSTSNADDAEKLRLSSINLYIDPYQEWLQIFDEAYRYNRDYFFVEDMAKNDWDSIAERYRPLVDRISTRGELNDIIGNLIGELGMGHTYRWGGDALESAESVGVGLLGADIRLDEDRNLYYIERLYEGETWNDSLVNPLATTDNEPIKAGDYILAVNNREITGDENFYSYFWNLDGQEITLSVSDGTDFDAAVDYRVEPIGSETALRYHAWVEANRQRTNELSDGKIGYVHLPDMSTTGLYSFFHNYYPQVDKEALVIDVRWNRGGNVSQLIIRRLAVELYAVMQSRNYKQPYTYPAARMNGPLAVLTNYRTASDGDIFSHSFRKNELGPLIGERTWGGVVGIRYQTRFVDGGQLTVPEFSFIDGELGYGIENAGIEPDIQIHMLPSDEINDADPQLERAVEYLWKKFQNGPRRLNRRKKAQIVQLKRIDRIIASG